ncbi:MAG: GNAT family N-acetyltransferase [Acidobacteria bacterium]|nr:GNAT family N-acetyltransferase [Acidobacteriota bacterium]
MPAALHLVPASAELEWSLWLEPVAHDFYHTAAYHRFSEESGEGEGFLAVYGSRERFLAWPYLLRPLGSLRDITSVYGYSGPLAFGCRSYDDLFLNRARREIRELWRSQQAVSAFTRLHPLLENHCWAGDANACGSTVSIDLTLDEAAIWHDYQPGLRNRIHHGRRLGLATEIDDTWRRLEDFAGFYQATMLRNHAAPSYFFSVDYFRRLKRALGSSAFLFLTRCGRDIAAAGIFTEYSGIVQNHFSVNNQQYLRLAPSKVLLDDVRRWAKARRNRVFHLGGGRGGRQDSLFAFKAAFSSRHHVFYASRRVLDARTYGSLCEGLPVPAASFFPAYRAQL